MINWQTNANADANRRSLIQETRALTINDKLFSKEIRTMVTPCKSSGKSECIRAECGTGARNKKGGLKEGGLLKAAEFHLAATYFREILPQS